MKDGQDLERFDGTFRLGLLKLVKEDQLGRYQVIDAAELVAMAEEPEHPVLVRDGGRVFLYEPMDPPDKVYAIDLIENPTSEQIAEWLASPEGRKAMFEGAARMVWREAERVGAELGVSTITSGLSGPARVTGTRPLAPQEQPPEQTAGSRNPQEAAMTTPYEEVKRLYEETLREFGPDHKLTKNYLANLRLMEEQMKNPPTHDSYRIFPLRHPAERSPRP